MKRNTSRWSWELKVNPGAIPQQLIKEDFLVEMGREQGLQVSHLSSYSPPVSGRNSRRAEVMSGSPGLPQHTAMAAACT